MSGHALLLEEPGLGSELPSRFLAPARPILMLCPYACIIVSGPKLGGLIHLIISIYISSWWMSPTGTARCCSREAKKATSSRGEPDTSDQCKAGPGPVRPGRWWHCVAVHRPADAVNRAMMPHRWRKHKCSPSWPLVTNAVRWRHKPSFSATYAVQPLPTTTKKKRD